MKLPQNFHKELRKNSFKKELIKFLPVEFGNEENLPLIGDKTIRLSSGENFSHSKIEQKLEKAIDRDPCSTNEEADTRMVLHLTEIPSLSTVIIRTSYTDVLAILLSNFKEIQKNVRMYLEEGFQSNYTLRYLDISTVANSLGPSLCEAIASFHAFSGCDYILAFSRKVKVRPLSISQANPYF